MSALGQKQTYAPQKSMSAFTPESRHVQCNRRCLLRANSGYSAIHSNTSSATHDHARRGQAPSLLQVNGLIAPVLIELRTPHLVHALMLGFAESHGRPEPNVEVAEIFESLHQSFGVELRAISI